VADQGGGQFMLFFSTGIEGLDRVKKLEKFVLAGVLDKGGNTQCVKGDKACEKFEVKLEKADGSKGDERATGAPVVAGNTVFWTTVTEFPDKPCDTPLSSLFAYDFSGNPAFDTDGDGKIDPKKDKALFREPLGRATAPFVADKHLYFGVDDGVEILGEPEGFNNGTIATTGRLLSWREIR
jgi:hypothetical protein